LPKPLYFPNRQIPSCRLSSVCRVRRKFDFIARQFCIFLTSGRRGVLNGSDGLESRPDTGTPRQANSRREGAGRIFDTPGTSSMFGMTADLVKGRFAATPGTAQPRLAWQIFE
jgi:hypothetical protein